MSTELDLDIAALVGEMDVPGCEHSQHDVKHLDHDNGPATHYLQSSCTGCGRVGRVYPGCATWVAYIKSGFSSRCPSCRVLRAAFEGIRIIGPVTK